MRLFFAHELKNLSWQQLYIGLETFLQLYKEPKKKVSRHDRRRIWKQMKILARAMPARPDIRIILSLYVICFNCRSRFHFLRRCPRPPHFAGTTQQSLELPEPEKGWSRTTPFSQKFVTSWITNSAPSWTTTLLQSKMLVTKLLSDSVCNKTNERLNKSTSSRDIFVADFLTEYNESSTVESMHA